MNVLNPFETEYDIPTTLLYGFLFVIAVYLIYKYFVKRLKIKIDRKFSLAVLPFIFFGSSLRVLEDMKFLKSKLFVTPYIYFLVAFITICVFYFFIKLKKKEYWKFCNVIGFSLFLISISFVPVYKNPLFGSYSYLIVFGVFSFLYLLYKRNFISKENSVALFTQLYDASITSVAMYFFGYKEKHVLPTFIILLTGNPFSFMVLKFIVIYIVLLYIDKKIKGKNLRNYLKFVIALLGIATGTRDLLRGLANV